MPKVSPKNQLLRLKCSYAGKCSGCPEIRQIYAKQLSDKKKYLEVLFSPLLRQHGLTLPEIIPSPKIAGYRSTAKLCLHQGNNHEIAIGIYRKNTKLVEHISECPVHDPMINTSLKKLFFNPHTPPPADFYNHNKKTYQPGKFKFVTMRTHPLSEHLGIILSHTGVIRDQIKNWLSQLDLQNIAVYSALIKEQDQGKILTQNIDHLFGPERINIQVGGIEHHLSPMSFAQANASLLESFHQHITEGLEGETLLDLFSGFGGYGFSLHKTFAKIFLVEGDGFAIRDATYNAERLGLKNVTPIASYCENFLEQKLSASERKSVNHIIVNPPRSGLTHTVKKFLDRKYFPSLQTLTYVSCSPATLKNDLYALCPKPQTELYSMQGFDMFPQTDHIETVVKIRFLG